MHWLDWSILLGTLGFIVGYGVWKTRAGNTSADYLRGGSDERWWAVGLSVMATQASAITFLSTPGQGYLDGLGRMYKPREDALKRLDNVLEFLQALRDYAARTPGASLHGFLEANLMPLLP